MRLWVLKYILAYLSPHRRFGDYGAEFWEETNQFFDCLPHAVSIASSLSSPPSILCMHGGIGEIPDIASIRLIPRPIKSMESSKTLLDLVWSDPADHDGVNFSHSLYSRKCTDENFFD